ncbi:hypothetical protein V6N13_070873 [Hibiscus sabdariffa]|uniref:non-specific serine/threonine protein kinase n=1 Tax=Hibiscus sabdariffa TaxID=183260 RepID=A0ABR2TF42_9ROSI
MSRNLAAILGGAAGAVALVVIVGLLIWFCLFRKRGLSRTSDTGSSDPSVQGRHIGVQLSLREAKHFELRELSSATKNFSDRNLIGEGKFGEVYKGLLQDGVLVAIKKRAGAPSNEFIDEARYLSSIQHRNLVTLLGYCQENNQQFLVYEYIPNGSVSIHLYGVGQGSAPKIEFKHRLSIALGAAKGDPLQNQIGSSPLSKSSIGPSSQVMADEIFLAPEVREFRRFSEKSDAYSFGVFLLELVSGREASELPSSNSTENLVELVQNSQDYSNISSIIDSRLGSRFTAEGMEEFIKLTVRCLEPSSERRPAMSDVVTELDRILDKEMSLTTVMGEGSPTVTLGSQLFRATT